LTKKGSAGSKDPRQRHRHHASRAVTPAPPWPARRGDWILRIYEHSLSLAFLLHAVGGRRLWQSEFLAIGCMVVLSIFLREVNSPESRTGPDSALGE
jgi:hypothetical protein